MSDVLTIDIETCETIDSDIIKDISDNIKPPKTIKLQKSIDTWMKEKKPDAVKVAVSKTSFDGFAGGIICIGFAVNDNEPISLSRDFNQSEKVLLNAFWIELVATYGVNFNPLWVAHNVAFDLPFLYKRCVVHNVKPSIPLPINPKPWSKEAYCTMYNSVGDKAGGSLNRIAKVLNLGQKTEGISGAEINQAWLDGRDQEIVEYCRQDVELCRGIYKRLNFIDKIKG